MFVLTCYLSIGNVSFVRASEVEIKTSWKTVADSATVVLPGLKKMLAEQVGGGDGIKVGDDVLIQLGYGDDVVTEFTGFVKRIEPNVPLKIECEDYAWVLRRKNYSKAWKNTNLKTVLQYLISKTDIELAGNIPDVNFEKFRLDDVNGVFALEKIKDEFGLTLYFRGKTLYAGLAYTLETNLPKV